MKSGYKISWTNNATAELEDTISYLEKNFPGSVIRRLVQKLERILTIIADNPELYPSSQELPHIRRAVILKFNTMYYTVKNNEIIILSFFSNRKDKSKLEL